MVATTTPVRSKSAILITLCLAALIINIDVTIVNVALPSLVRELGATTTKLQWVVDAYTLVFAALILAAGSISDRVGRNGILLAGLVAWSVPTSRDPNVRPIDMPGLVLSSVGMGTLILAIIQAPDWGWGSAPTLGTLGAGLLVIAAFVTVERRTEQPMMDVSLFRNPRFTAASGSITIGFFVLAGFSFLMTQYFQFIKGYTPFGTGVRLLPVAVSIAVAAVLGTRLAVRIGNNAVVGAGLALWGGAVLWIATVNASTPYSVIVAQMLMGGGGLGLITAPATEAIMGAVPTNKAGVGSTVNDATRLFGAALGVAVIGSVAASLYHTRLGATLPAGLPAHAASAAQHSGGGALIAAQ